MCNSLSIYQKIISMLFCTISKKKKAVTFPITTSSQLSSHFYIDLSNQMNQPMLSTTKTYMKKMQERQMRLDKNKAASYSQEYMTPKREQSK